MRQTSNLLVTIVDNQEVLFDWFRTEDILIFTLSVMDQSAYQGGNFSQESSGEASGRGEASTLDQTLLESLFYDEMMRMDESTSMISNVLSPDSQVPTDDTSAMVESALLGEFGMAQGKRGGIVQPSPSVVASGPTQPEMAAMSTSSSNGSLMGGLLGAFSPSMPPPAACRGVDDIPNMDEQQNPGPSPPQLPPNLSSINVEDEANRKKLASQFETLASRLGVPRELVQSFVASGKIPSGGAAIERATANPGTAPPSSSVLEDLPLAPQVQEQLSTAEAAIAAANRKRNGSTDSGGKRRKKPRMVDCERRLATLQAENAMLKRHLQNISEQSHKLAEEQAAAQKQMVTLLNSGATEPELDMAVSNFTELYSDYGKRRNDELAFHLEQLGRLANPSNVTKMGLWMLGLQGVKEGKDPIVGILQKELGISDQQGKKILEQRQKIRDVSANVREVSETA